jgi:hypothetical protein
MPKINQLNVIDVTPEKFLRECSVSELIETELLLQSAHNQIRMYGSYAPDAKEKITTPKAIEENYESRN